MELSTRQRRALEEICETFCPSAPGTPPPGTLRVADAVLEAVARNPRASERRQLAALLSLWDNQVLGALGGAGFKRFGDLPQAQREQVLLSWGDSRLPQRRAVFQALRKAALLFYYMLPRPGRRAQPGVGRDRLRRAARQAEHAPAEGART